MLEVRLGTALADSDLVVFVEISVFVALISSVLWVPLWLWAVLRWWMTHQDSKVPGPLNRFVVWLPAPFALGSIALIALGSEGFDGAWRDYAVVLWLTVGLIMCLAGWLSGALRLQVRKLGKARRLSS